MLKKIWQSLVRWFRKLVGRGTSSRSHDRLQPDPLPPLDDTDREYLFMQLLEGVAHGWQQPRAVSFFNKIRHRIRKSEWLEWLDRFGANLVESPVPNYELATRMAQLSQLDCGEVGDLAGEYAAKLLNRQAEEYPLDFLPIMEFSSAEPELLTVGGLDEYDRSISTENRSLAFGEVPPELLIDHNPLPSQPPRSFQAQAEEEDPNTETREITLEEFSAMLYKDAGLVAELAEQFGIETTDPQVIINAVIAQMQQQVQPISGDLSATVDEPIEPPLTPIAPPTTSTPPPEIPAPPQPTATHTDDHSVGVASAAAAAHPEPLRERPMPPPPPTRKLEYKAEDPWVAPVAADEDALSEAAKSIDRSA
jgi:hypothetical protein